MTELSKSRRFFRTFIRIASIFSAFILAGFLSITVVFMLILHKGLPSLEVLRDYRPKTVSQVYSEHGDVVAEFYEERRYVRKEVPDRIRYAFIAAEDAKFFFHKGVDFLGILRAAYVNLVSGRARQGASTITQQVARAFLLTPKKTITRKLKEIVLAYQIESSLSKDEIIFLYLNHIYLGAGAYGVAAAAERYFGKDLNELTLAEAAMLAGLPQAPHKYAPNRNPDRAKRRQLYVLKQMLGEKFISKEDYEAAVQETIYIEPPINLNKTAAPYFTENIRQYVMNKYSDSKVLHEGLRIFTTLDLDMNRYAQNAIRKGLSDLEKRQGYKGPLKKLSPEEAQNYFKDRDFEERDDESVIGNQTLEVSAKEAKAAGAIKMRPPRDLESGDWLEGIVREISDEKGEAWVEYAPEYRARLLMADMKWATVRVDLEDDEQVIHPVEKVSDVLKVNDVIHMSVKEAPKSKGSHVEALLEQDTVVEGALLSLDPRSGYVRAMVGGYDFNRSQFNRATQAKRQPGSAFKPIVYAAALDLGFTPASLLQDSPITFENPSDEEKWRPSNYDERFVGDVTLRNSLLASRNITTIRLLNEVGLDRAIHYARRVGIKSPLQRDFTLALGSSVVPLIELMQPYIVFSTGGYRRDPIMIKRIEDRDGDILEENVPESIEAPSLDRVREALTHVKKEIASIEFSKDDLELKADESASFLQESGDQDGKKNKVITSPLKPGQVLSTETSFLMAHLLKENVLYGTGKRARELKRPASGKTGTTDENRDAWFMGFTPEFVTGVWVGYDDLRKLGRSETGSSSALPIWVDFMIRATALYPESDFAVPETIEFARIDPKTGGLASSTSKSSAFEAFVKGTAPREVISDTKSPLDLYQRDR